MFLAVLCCTSGSGGVQTQIKTCASFKIFKKITHKFHLFAQFKVGFSQFDVWKQKCKSKGINTRLLYFPAGGKSSFQVLAHKPGSGWTLAR